MHSWDKETGDPSFHIFNVWTLTLWGWKNGRYSEANHQEVPQGKTVYDSSLEQGQVQQGIWGPMIQGEAAEGQEAEAGGAVKQEPLLWFLWEHAGKAGQVQGWPGLGSGHKDQSHGAWPWND